MPSRPPLSTLQMVGNGLFWLGVIWLSGAVLGGLCVGFKPSLQISCLGGLAAMGVGAWLMRRSNRNDS